MTADDIPAEDEFEDSGHASPGVPALLRLTVPLEAAGQRLDRFAADGAGVGLSRTRIQALIESGDVRIGGRPANDASRKVKAGEEIEISVPPPVDDTPAPEDIPLDIVFEDRHLLVINKPAGLVVHPAAGHATGTLVNALLHHCRDSLSGIGGVRRPGIVHRLDKDTSGLMIVAKTDESHHHLAAQLSTRTLSRRYTACIWKAPRFLKGKVDVSVGRHPTNRQKMAAGVKGGRDAVTHYTADEKFGEAAARVTCALETGRTHQIRVHMDYIGHPLIGDPLYGIQQTAARALLKRGGYEEEAAAIILGFPRQALHAAEIGFIHPAKEKDMRFSAPLPEDMERLLAALRQGTP